MSTSARGLQTHHLQTVVVSNVKVLLDGDALLETWFLKSSSAIALFYTRTAHPIDRLHDQR